MPASAAPRAPRFDHRTDNGPVLGIGNPAPRLSWTVPTADDSWAQSAYEIEVARQTGYETYHVDSGEQVLVPWPAPPLRSRESATVRVRVASGDQWSPWSETSVVEAGLLVPSDWSGSLISPTSIAGIGEPAPVLTGVLDVPGRVQRARLYATAHGLYSAEINGHLVSDALLAPGWTAYQQRLRYQTYDVTSLVQTGDNELQATLGNGWFRGYLGYCGERALYGDRLAFLAQLEVTTDDGAVYTLATDGSWTAHESHILQDDLYNGQRTDLRGRTTPKHTSGVELLSTDLGRLVAPEGPAIRATDTLPAQRVWQSPAGRTLVDFGQNAVGWVRLRTHALQAGTEVTVRHAEVLESDELGTRPLRAAKATDSYVLAGGEEVLEPTFTLHGFRYAEVTGVPNLHAEDLELVVIGSDLVRTGWFRSSDERVNQLHENVVWSMRGNFVDVPTDCPQRDERLGWTGDIQVFSPTATFLNDVNGFLSSWLADLAAEQGDDGAVPYVIPNANMTSEPEPQAAAWGDAATIVPWNLYQRAGDLGLLERQFPSMRAWVDKIATLAGPTRLWDKGFQFGDWLDPAAPPDRPADAKADPGLVATAYLARSADIVAKTAVLLGRTDVAERYGRLAAEVRTAFAQAYVTSTGLLFSDAQTAYALALEWDLLPTSEQRAAASRRLADLVRASGFHIATGFVGTPLICDALTNTGHGDVAYRLLTQTECPSWLYPVTMGATTVWERWDSMLPDGSINPGDMTSFNHYALGAVADWLHRSVAGLAPAAPGYRRITVRPHVSRHLGSAGARHTTPYGDASVEWARSDGRLRLVVRIPVGAQAEIFLPGSSETRLVGHGEHHWDVPDPVDDLPESRDWSALSVRDLIDDGATWRRVVEAAIDCGTVRRGESEVAAILGTYMDAPADRVAHYLATDDRFPGATELRHRVAAILTGLPADVAA